MTRPCSWWNGGVAPLTTSPPRKHYQVARPQTQSVIIWRGGAWRRRQRSDSTVSRTLDALVVAVRRPVQIALQRAVQTVVTALVVVGPFAGPIFAAWARAWPCLGAGLDVGSIRGIRLSLLGGLVARSLAAAAQRWPRSRPQRLRIFGRAGLLHGDEALPHNQLDPAPIPTAGRHPLMQNRTSRHLPRVIRTAVAGPVPGPASSGPLNLEAG
jgi:hypothetical protein